MTQLREVCEEIVDKYLNENLAITEEKRMVWSKLGRKVETYLNSQFIPPAHQDVEFLLKVAHWVAEKPKNTSHDFEEDLLKAVYTYTSIITDEKKPMYRTTILNDTFLQHPEASYLQEFHNMCYQLKVFALSLFEVKKKYDSFRGKRLGIATKILASLGNVYEISEMETLIINNYKERSLYLLRYMAEVLLTYYTENSRPVPDEIFAAIHTRMDKAKSSDEYDYCIYALDNL